MLVMILMKNLATRKTGVEMNKVEREILLITQEECAEVTQAISKVFRFGFAGKHNGKSNKERLEEELGDLLCMVDLIMTSYMADEAEVLKAKAKKAEKLNTWSSIKTKVEDASV